MMLDRTVLLVCFAALSAPSVYASSGRETVDVNATDNPLFSSSSSLPDAPDADAISAAARERVDKALGTRLRLGTRPFSSVAVAVIGGVEGLGVDVATPLATKINLRASASFLSASPSFVQDGIPLDTAITLRAVNAGVELFPYHNSFHITPGVTLYNGNHAGALVHIAGGATFSVDDTDYVSDPADPVHGTFDVYLGRRVAPSLTIGFGNMLRRDSHWSVPVDFGVQYIGTPIFTLNLIGSVCTPQDGCTRIQDDAETQQNLRDETAKVNDGISILRFYPILKVGLSYRFGHNAKLEYWR